MSVQYTYYVLPFCVLPVDLSPLAALNALVRRGRYLFIYLFIYYQLVHISTRKKRKKRKNYAVAR